MTPTTHEQASRWLRNPMSRHAGPARTLLLRLAGAHLERIVIGISARQLLGMLPADAVTPGRPERDPWMGMVDWSGRQTPVADLAVCLGLNRSEYRQARRLACLRCPRHSQAIAVPVTAELTQLHNTDDALPAVPEPGMAEEYIRGVFHLGPELLVIPDLDAIWERILAPALGGAGQS